ncbi:MAG: hypothetical protein IKE74_05645 [Mogibacterium sp.]|nr:hypothetical protein [Mogibacterium sp.]
MIIYSLLKMREWALKKCFWDIRLMERSSSVSKMPRDPLEVGKDADFLVFDNDLLTAEHDGFSNNMPKDVYSGGKKIN